MIAMMSLHCRSAARWQSILASVEAKLGESTGTGATGLWGPQMTNIAMENPNHKWRLMSLGKSSMGHLYHGYVK